MEASGQLNLPDPEEHIPYRIINPGEPGPQMVGKNFVDSVEVEYETPSGTIDKVTIPEREYNPAAVDRAIQERLHRSEGVAALGPVPHPENLSS